MMMSCMQHRLPKPEPPLAELADLNYKNGHRRQLITQDNECYELTKRVINCTDGSQGSLITTIQRVRCINNQQRAEDVVRRPSYKEHSPLICMYTNQLIKLYFDILMYLF